MKRLLMVLVLALMVGVLTLSTSGVAGAKKHNKVDSAEGKGEFVTEPNPGFTQKQKFDFDARDLDQDPLTDAAKGMFKLHLDQKFNGASSSGSFKAEVVCLRVEDGRAVFVSRVKETSGLFKGLEGQLYGVHVLDAGQPKGNGDGIALFSTGSETCPAPTSDLYQPLTHGNITVKDVV